MNGANSSTSTGIGTAVEAAARGGHLRGDFPRYYDFHTTGPRIQALLGDAEAQRVLSVVAAAAGAQPGLLLLSDWGSNAGDLTLELARRLQAETGRAVAALGLELNAGLVERARGLVAAEAAAAQQQQQQRAVELEFEALDVVAEEERAQALVRAFARRHGRGEGEGEGNTRRVVDVLTVFSTTMWVHLAHGDEGLTRMLRWGHWLGVFVSLQNRVVHIILMYTLHAQGRRRPDAVHGGGAAGQRVVPPRAEAAAADGRGPVGALYRRP